MVDDDGPRDRADDEPGTRAGRGERESARDERSDPASSAAAFDLVADETRIRILRELARAQAASPRAPAVRFSALRERLGGPDSGTFNYHLNRLRGRFVRRTDEGYVLTPAGHRLAAAVAAGAYGSEETVDGEPLGEACPVCGEELSVTFADGALSVRCPAGHGVYNLFPGGALEGRDATAVRSLFDRVTRQQVDLAVAGDCPLCYASMETRVVERAAGTKAVREGSGGESEDGDGPDRGDGSERGGGAQEWGIEAVCPRCGALVDVPLSLALGGHPVVEALLTARGQDPRRRRVWGATSAVRWAVERLEGADADEGSKRLLATVAVGGDRVVLGVGEDCSVRVEETPEWLRWNS